MIGTVMAYGGAVFVGLTFIALLKTFKLLETAPHVTAVSTLAFRDLRDPLLDDEAKEVRMRGHAKALGLLFMRLTVGTLAAVAAPLGVVWLLDAAGVVSLNRVLDALASWPLLVAGTLGMMAQLWLGKGASHGS
jgi:hypothetical protein